MAKPIYKNLAFWLLVIFVVGVVTFVLGAVYQISKMLDRLSIQEKEPEEAGQSTIRNAWHVVAWKGVLISGFWY